MKFNCLSDNINLLLSCKLLYYSKVGWLILYHWMKIDLYHFYLKIPHNIHNLVIYVGLKLGYVCVACYKPLDGPNGYFACTNMCQTCSERKFKLQNDCFVNGTIRFYLCSNDFVTTEGKAFLTPPNWISSDDCSVSLHKKYCNSAYVAECIYEEKVFLQRHLSNIVDRPRDNKPNSLHILLTIWYKQELHNLLQKLQGDNSPLNGLVINKHNNVGAITTSDCNAAIASDPPGLTHTTRTIITTSPLPTLRPRTPVVRNSILPSVSGNSDYSCINPLRTCYHNAYTKHMHSATNSYSMYSADSHTTLSMHTSDGISNFRGDTILQLVNHNSARNIDDTEYTSDNDDNSEIANRQTSVSVNSTTMHLHANADTPVQFLAYLFRINPPWFIELPTTLTYMYEIERLKLYKQLSNTINTNINQSLVEVVKKCVHMLNGFSTHPYSPWNMNISNRMETNGLAGNNGTNTPVVIQPLKELVVSMHKRTNAIKHYL